MKSTPADQLKAKLKEWRFRLDEGDVHSISRQVSSMLWRSAFYRSINESRKVLKHGNGSLHELINDGYLIMHATAIRRLVDHGSYGGSRGVNSLRGLIEDIRRNGHRLTRGDVIAARGLVYNYEPIREQAVQKAHEEAKKKGERSSFVSGVGWSDSEYWHDTWDELCGTLPGKRDRSDRPPDAAFHRLLRELDAGATDVAEYVNKYIAHAATDASRMTIAPDRRSLSLDKLWRAERAIVRAANFLSRSFGNGSDLGGVPVPQFDQFEHLGEPFIAKGASGLLQAAWDAHEAEIDKCRNWNWGEPLANKAPKSKS